MKLLLTSAGITNQTIKKATEQLLEKPMNLPAAKINGTKLAFIPTAANIEPGDKSWMIEDLNNFQKVGFEVDIVDISAISKKLWLPRLQDAEILFFDGGNSCYLMHWVKQSGLQEELPALLETRIYAGISAGSCIVGPTVTNAVQDLFGETNEFEVKEGLGFLDIQVVPHLNSPCFDKIREKYIAEEAKKLEEPVYALDDNSALIVVNGNIEVVSDGVWKRFN